MSAVHQAPYDPLDALARANPAPAAHLPDGRSPQAQTLLALLLSPQHAEASTNGSGGNDVGRPFTQRRRRAATIVAVALTLLVVLAGTSAGQSLTDGFLARLSGWLTGAPGEVAPAQDSGSFAEANAAAYAKFPAGSDLRLLLHGEAAGLGFDLLGFRQGDSICLRLVRADYRSDHRSPVCMPRRELASINAPAVVAGTVRYDLGGDPRCDDREVCRDYRPTGSVQATFGLVGDEVSAMKLRTFGGRSISARLANSGFLALTPSGEGDPGDTVIAALAELSDGNHLAVPLLHPDIRYISSARDLATKSLVASDLPGPVQLDYEPAGGSIGWLLRRESRGDAFGNRDQMIEHTGSSDFARAVQPDPASAYRVGFTLLRVEAEQYGGSGNRGKTLLCVQALPPLESDALRGACGPPDKLFAARPERMVIADPAGTPGGPILLAAASRPDSQFPAVVGAVSDDVATLRLYFAHGAAEQVPIKNNAFALQVAGIKYPAKLVAYDASGRVIGMELIPRAPYSIGIPRASASLRQHERPRKRTR